MNWLCHTSIGNVCVVYHRSRLHVGDDGIFGGMQQSLIIEGVRVWHVDEKGLDPNTNPWIPGLGDLIHNDGVQFPGAVADVQIRGSHFMNNLMLFADNGNLSVAVDDTWLAGCGGLGIVTGARADKQNRAQISMRDVHGFGNGWAFRGNAGWNHLLTEQIGDRSCYWPDSLHDVRCVVIDLGGTSDLTPPAGIPMSGPYMVNPEDALTHPQNPALLWRKQHPYDNWRQALAV